jgi:hypothetical protein
MGRGNAHNLTITQLEQESASRQMIGLAPILSPCSQSNGPGRQLTARRENSRRQWRWVGWLPGESYY